MQTFGLHLFEYRNYVNPYIPVTRGFLGDTVGIYGPSAKEPNRTVLDLAHRHPIGCRPPSTVGVFLFLNLFENLVRFMRGPPNRI